MLLEASEQRTWEVWAATFVRFLGQRCMTNLALHPYPLHPLSFVVSVCRPQRRCLLVGALPHQSLHHRRFLDHYYFVLVPYSMPQRLQQVVQALLVVCLIQGPLVLLLWVGLLRLQTISLILAQIDRL